MDDGSRPIDDESPEVERLAAGPLDERDRDLLAGIARAAAAMDPMPPGLVERATFAVALEELEVEVASLQESSWDGRALAGVRGSEDPALTMTFTAAALALTIAVVETRRGHHRMDGWITSDHPVTVTLRLGEDGRRQATVSDGRFVFDDVPAGMVQVLVAGTDDDPGAATVVTPVFEL